jgi:hypothetical protein
MFFSAFFPGSRAVFARLRLIADKAARIGAVSPTMKPAPDATAGSWVSAFG